VPEGKEPGLGAWVDWALKVGPVLVTGLLFFFTLYTNQAAMMKHDGEVDKRLVQLETQANVQDRALVERLAKIDASISELNHDLQFYLQTRNGK
jgi:hypothetical protein